MRKTLFALALIATLVPLAMAQDGRAPLLVALRGNTPILSAQPGAEPAVKSDSYYPPFCPPKTCLYYAGDFDSNNINTNGLFNANYNNGQLEGQTWVGVKPDQDATVTGVTFVQSFTQGFTSTNPTPFAVQVGIKPGQAGQTICAADGNATYKLLGYFYEIPFYSVTIKKLSNACRLKRGRVYYVNLLPTSTNGYGWLVNVVDARPKDHHGWKNDLNDCYFNGTGFGENYDYVTCNSQGTFPEFSIALTGKEKQ